MRREFRRVSRRVAGLSMALVVCAVARGQTATEGPKFDPPKFEAPKLDPPKFDVAEVRLNKSGVGDVDYDESPSGLFSVRNISLSALFQDAFHVRRDAIIGAPGWFDSDRFDIVGKAPPETSDEIMMLMAQSLILEQFKMRVHREQRVQGAFVLSVSKGGPKMAKSSGKGDAACNRVRAQSNDYSNQHLACTNETMADFADKLGSEIGRGYIDKTVLDQTGLAGAYDFRLDFSSFRNVDKGGITIFGAIEKIGLKLKEKKAPLPVVVIDHAERFVPEPE